MASPYDPYVQLIIQEVLDISIEQAYLLIHIAQLPTGSLNTALLIGQYHTLDWEKGELLEELHVYSNL